MKQFTGKLRGVFGVIVSADKQIKDLSVNSKIKNMILRGYIPEVGDILHFEENFEIKKITQHITDNFEIDQFCIYVEVY